MKLVVLFLYVHSSQLHPTWCILGSTYMPVISIQMVYSTFCEAHSPTVWDKLQTYARHVLPLTHPSQREVG